MIEFSGNDPSIITGDYIDFFSNHGEQKSQQLMGFTTYTKNGVFVVRTDKINKIWNNNLIILL